MRTMHWYDVKFSRTQVAVNDLVSISRTDARDNVYARFAVVRRARMVARWR